MLLKDYFWQFKGVLSKKTCHKIIELGKSQRKQIGVIGKYYNKNLTSKGKKDLLKKRNSHVVFINSQWVYDLISPYIYHANRNSGWNFEYDWLEAMQFSMYKKGQFYGWHPDTIPPTVFEADPKIAGKHRKISTIVQLSSPDDYSGGDTEIDPRQNDPDESKPIILYTSKVQGTITCFPSFLWHRVLPVKKGIRYSLILWVRGKPFK